MTKKMKKRLIVGMVWLMMLGSLITYETAVGKVARDSIDIEYVNYVEKAVPYKSQKINLKIVETNQGLYLVWDNKGRIRSSKTTGYTECDEMSLIQIEQNTHNGIVSWFLIYNRNKKGIKYVESSDGETFELKPVGKDCWKLVKVK